MYPNSNKYGRIKASNHQQPCGWLKDGGIAEVSILARRATTKCVAMRAASQACAEWTAKA